ncbi:MAG: EthD family reductase [Chloroflexota bacterium]
MHKLMLLFQPPDDIEHFETQWSHEFVPRAERLPGLRRVAVSRALESLAGVGELYLVHELYFDNLAAARQAMASPEGQQAGQALMRFAASNVRLYFAEHLEESRPAPPA